VTPRFERKACITGIGMSDVGRRLMRDPLELTVDACLAAIADAGLTRADIDGLSTYPGPMGGLHGISGGGVVDVEDVLRVRPRWFNSGLELPGQTGSVMAAAMAVATGLCRHVLCFRCVWESSFQELQRRGRLPGGPSRASGDAQWRLPFGAASAANWIALFASRHFALYGTTREHLAQIALNARRNAALNPRAIYREPLSLEDYLSARMISTPLGLYDCDIPCDGAVAVIVSHIDAARDTRRPAPVRFEAFGAQIAERPSWDQGELTHEPLMQGAARSLWERTDLKPSDVDVAELYDGFSFNCLCWIERLGFCPIGEGGRFLEGGKRIARDGELPLNTHGGQLSAGRLHGYGFLHEACVQLWGEAGGRQVAGNPQVALVATGGGAPGGAMLLTRS
jgi:acetyl-CoA acetyltransferase